MNLTHLVQKLEKKFNINEIPPDMPFSKLIPKIYNEMGIEFRRYFTESFLNSFHGLMIHNCEEINKVYLTVFLSEEILDKIFIRGEKNILVFSHHPMDMESSNRGFLPLAVKYLKEMQKRHISIYVLHTPLDIHKKISTSNSIAKILGLVNLISFHKNSVGFSGIVGDLAEKIDFEEFIIYLQKIFTIKDIHYIKNQEKVLRVGIIAGGGSDPKYIKEATELGCDTYLTGDYINKIKNEYGIRQKKNFEEIKPSININLIECSHYATEKIVLQKEISQIFIREGVVSEFLEQNNPWK